MAATSLIRIGPEEVVWYEADSLERLAGRLRARRPERAYGAYAIQLKSPTRTRVFVFSGVAFQAYWRTAAEVGFSTAEVERIFLRGKAAARVDAGARPDAPAHDPKTGAVWVAEARRSGVVPRRVRRQRRAPGTRRKFRDLNLSLPTGSLPGAPSALGGDQAPLYRIPHMDIAPDGGLSAGDEFRVEVFCNLDGARSGEQVEKVAVELPFGQDEVTLQAWLALSLHFVGDRLVREITIARDEPDSTRAGFDLAVAADAPSGPGRVSAVFHHEGRPCGQVTRFLSIAAEPDSGSPAQGPTPPVEAPEDSEQLPRPPRLLLRNAMRRCDLAIEIKMTDDSEQEFACRVITPDRPDPEPTRWHLNTRAPDLVAGYLEGFTEEGLDDGERITRLRGAGMELWKAAPAGFRDIFWNLIDAGERPRSIFVVSDEWSFPWELLVPVRGGSGEAEIREPLGVEFSLGRWITDEMLAPPQQLTVVDSYVFAPQYGPGQSLAHAEEEESYICENLNGESIQPGEFARLEEKFAERGVSLAHFTCHGGASVNHSQVLLLENGKKLMSHQIAAMQGLSAAVAECEPLVFLNACELGRPQPALVGVGGFATAFIAAGASCVVAPLWSVADDVAYELAISFYEELRADRAAQPAAILKSLRARAYGNVGADTWAAYCFYGDPLTEIEIEMTAGEAAG